MSTTTNIPEPSGQQQGPLKNMPWYKRLFDRNSIVNQLRFSLIGVIFISLLIISLILIFQAVRAQHSLIQTVQQQQSQAIASKIEHYFVQLLDPVAYIVQVEDLLYQPPEFQANLLLSLLHKADNFQAVVIVNERGELINQATVDDLFEVELFATSPLFEQVISREQVVFSPVERNLLTHAPMMAFGMPIRGAEGVVEGALLARINLSDLWQELAQTQLADEGYIYLINNQQELIAQTDGSFQEFAPVDISDYLAQVDHASSVSENLFFYPGLYDSYVVGKRAILEDLEWQVVAELPIREAYASISNMLGLMLVGIMLTAILVVLGSNALLGRQLARPLQKLIYAAEHIQAGNLSPSLDITARNELGMLAATFRDMTERLEQTYTLLEERVDQRTQRLRVIANLSEQLGGILDLDRLAIELVNQVKQNFGYYHVHVYLLEQDDNLILRAGFGDAGAQMKAARHSISLTKRTSLVARAARTGEVVLVNNVQTAKDWLPNLLLPETKAEMAVPIVLDDNVVGVLDVQEARVDAFDESDISLMRSLGNQVAVAIRNARLFANVEQALEETNEAQARYLEQAWHKAKFATQQTKHLYLASDENKPDDQTITQARMQAVQADKPTLVSLSKNNRASAVDDDADESSPPLLVAPIILRNKKIGALQLHPKATNRPWTPQDMTVVNSIINQLSQTAESLRLFANTREQAGRERTIREITEKLRTAPTMQRLIEIATDELGQRLGAQQAKLVLGLELDKSTNGQVTTRENHE